MTWCHLEFLFYVGCGSLLMPECEGNAIAVGITERPSCTWLTAGFYGCQNRGQ